MILIIVLSLELLPGSDHDLETCSMTFSFVTLILSLIISKQRVPSSVLLLLTEEAPLLFFLVLATLFA
jgi:hypothetical protein